MGKSMGNILADYTEPPTSYNRIQIAEELDVNVAHIHNYFSGRRRISPTLKEAIYKKFPDLKSIRIRAEVSFESLEQKESALRYVQHRGFKSLTEFLRSIGNCDIAGDGYD